MTTSKNLHAHVDNSLMGRCNHHNSSDSVYVYFILNSESVLGVKLIVKSNGQHMSVNVSKILS